MRKNGKEIIKKLYKSLLVMQGQNNNQIIDDDETINEYPSSIDKVNQSSRAFNSSDLTPVQEETQNLQSVVGQPESENHALRLKTAMSKNNFSIKLNTEGSSLRRGTDAYDYLFTGKNRIRPIKVDQNVWNKVSLAVPSNYSIPDSEFINILSTNVTTVEESELTLDQVQAEEVSLDTEN